MKCPKCGGNINRTAEDRAECEDCRAVYKLKPKAVRKDKDNIQTALSAPAPKKEVTESNAVQKERKVNKMHKAYSRTIRTRIRRGVAVIVAVLGVALIPVGIAFAVGTSDRPDPVIESAPKPEPQKMVVTEKEKPTEEGPQLIEMEPLNTRDPDEEEPEPADIEPEYDEDDGEELEIITGDETVSENEAEGSEDASELEETDTAVTEDTAAPAAPVTVKGKVPVTSLASAESTAALNMYLDDLGAVCPGLVNSFISNGWQIILTPTLNRSQFGGPDTDLAGYTLPTTKTMYVVSDGYEYLVRHEMGHYLDHAMGQKNGMTWITDGPQFQAIYAKEGQSLGHAGALDAPEFFAEVFRHILTNPTTTQATCPEAYNYVMSCIVQF